MGLSEEGSLKRLLVELDQVTPQKRVPRYSLPQSSPQVWLLLGPCSLKAAILDVCGKRRPRKGQVKGKP